MSKGNAPKRPYGPVRVCDGNHWAYGLRGTAVRPHGDPRRLRVKLAGAADKLGRKRTIATLLLEPHQVEAIDKKEAVM